MRLVPRRSAHHVSSAVEPIELGVVDDAGEADPVGDRRIPAGTALEGRAVGVSGLRRVAVRAGEHETEVRSRGRHAHGGLEQHVDALSLLETPDEEHLHGAVAAIGRGRRAGPVANSPPHDLRLGRLDGEVGERLLEHRAGQAVDVSRAAHHRAFQGGQLPGLGARVTALVQLLDGGHRRHAAHDRGEAVVEHAHGALAEPEWRDDRVDAASGLVDLGHGAMHRGGVREMGVHGGALHPGVGRPGDRVHLVAPRGECRGELGRGARHAAVGGRRERARGQADGQPVARTRVMGRALDGRSE